jgi:hypothetical protein
MVNTEHTSIAPPDLSLMNGRLPSEWPADFTGPSSRGQERRTTGSSRGEGTMTTQDALTREGGKKLAHFLSVCLRIGWGKGDLDFLESLWLQHHDRNGRIA